MSIGACTTVATGGVGESGSTVMLVHSINASRSKQVVLRNAETSLCPNTGAAAMLLVNGVPRAHGDITAHHGSIQAEAQPGDHVVAVVHSFPLFNGVVCTRLGELHVTLDECDFVGHSGTGGTGDVSSPIDCSGTQTRDWYAWNNKMPPKPDDFHIVGEVRVANPGVDVELQLREPQGTNPAILQLTLMLTQRPGVWPSVVTWKEVRYDKVLVNSNYSSVDIFCSGKIISQVQVVDVH